MKSIFSIVLFAVLFCVNLYAETCIDIFKVKTQGLKNQARYLDRNVMKDRILKTGRSGYFLVGFESNAQGELWPMWSYTNHFSSDRFLPHGMFGDTGWNNLRESKLIQLNFSRRKGTSIEENPDYPISKELREKFKQGFIPETSVQNSPASFEELIKGFDQPKPRWQVLMMVASSNITEAMTVQEGRTGVLLRNGIPEVLRREDGVELLLEAKGIGLPEGGFRKPIRGTHGKISGGISVEDALHELEVSRNMKSFTSVYVPAIAKFEGFEGEQALALRWTPGTYRSSFRFNEQSGYLALNAKSLSRALGLSLSQAISQGYVPRLHMENFVVSKNSKSTSLTDFSDLWSISDSLKSDDFVESTIHNLYVLLFRNYINLREGFDPKEFYEAIEEEAERLGIPKSKFAGSFNPTERPVGSRGSLNYSQLANSQNMRYLISRFYAFGLVKSLGNKKISIGLRGLSIQSRESINRSIGTGKSEFEHLTARARELRSYWGSDRPDQFDQAILKEADLAIVRSKLGWSIEGARAYFAREDVRRSYYDYLKTYAVHYTADNPKSIPWIVGGVQIETELKSVFNRHSKLVMSLDLLWYAYHVTGNTEMSDFYARQLEGLMNTNPLAFYN